MHEPTGLYVYGGYGEQNDEAAKAVRPPPTTRAPTWFVQAGIERKFFALGKTTIFGEYRHDDVGFTCTDIDLGACCVDSTNRDLDFWAAGVVQNIENAAMDLYVIYRHAEGDLDATGGATVDLDDFDMVITGARIQF